MASHPSKLALLATLLTTSLAQQSVLTLPFYGYDDQPIVASVISADSSATTLSLACRAGTDGSDCGLFPMQTLTVGPSTYHMDTGAGAEFTGTQDCSTMGTTRAVCAESAGGSGANDPGSSTTTYEGDGIGVMAVTVTAGVDRLGAGGASASSGSGSSGPASTSATATSSGEVTVLTGSATSSGSSSASGSQSSSSTGTATESAASTSSSSAAIANARISGEFTSLVMAAAGVVAYWIC